MMVGRSASVTVVVCVDTGWGGRRKGRPNARPIPQQRPHKQHSHKQRGVDGRRKERSMVKGQLWNTTFRFDGGVPSLRPRASLLLSNDLACVCIGPCNNAQTLCVLKMYTFPFHVSNNQRSGLARLGAPALIMKVPFHFHHNHPSPCPTYMITGSLRSRFFAIPLAISRHAITPTTYTSTRPYGANSTHKPFIYSELPPSFVLDHPSSNTQPHKHRLAS
jgi:hypothetical protein